MPSLESNRFRKLLNRNEEEPIPEKLENNRFAKLLRKPQESEETAQEQLARTGTSIGVGGAIQTLLGPISGAEAYSRDIGKVAQPYLEQARRNLQKRQKNGEDVSKQLKQLSQTEKELRISGESKANKLLEKIEEKTGQPVVAKTAFQRYGQQALPTLAQPGIGLPAKTAQLFFGPAVSNVLQGAGVPESLAGPIGTVASGGAGRLTEVGYNRGRAAYQAPQQAQIAQQRAQNLPVSAAPSPTAPTPSGRLLGALQKVDQERKAQGEQIRRESAERQVESNIERIAAHEREQESAQATHQAAIEAAPETAITRAGTQALGKETAKGIPFAAKQTSGERDLGLYHQLPEAQRDPANALQDVISKERFVSPTRGGYQIENAVLAPDREMYERNSKRYDLSRKLTTNVRDIVVPMVQTLTADFDELENLGAKSDVTRKYQGQLKGILDKYGAGAGYQEFSAADLIKDIQELNRSAAYDFEHGEAKNIFRRAIGVMNEQVTNMLANSQDPRVLRAWQNAKEGHAEWSELFNNDYILPWRDKSNKNYSSKFNDSLTADNFPQINRVLQLSSDGKKLSQALKGQLVSSALGKDPGTLSPQEVSARLTPFDHILGQDEIASIQRKHTQLQGRTAGLKARARAITPPEAPAELKAPRLRPIEPPPAQAIPETPFLELTEPELVKKFDTIEGIRELKRAVGGSPELEGLFEVAAQDAIQNWLTDGKVNARPTGQDMYKFLNDRNNHRKMAELVGEPEVNQLMDLFEKIGKDEVSRSFATDAGKALLKFYGYSKLGKLLLPAIGFIAP